MTGRQDQAEVLRKERMAVSLRLAKRSYDEIATELGYSDKSAAAKAVKRALKRDVVVKTKDLRAEELGRIDLAMKAIMPDVMRGKLGAIDRMIALQRQLATYVPGLTEPERMDMTGANFVVEMAWPEPRPTDVVNEEDLAKPEAVTRARNLPPKL